MKRILILIGMVASAGVAANAQVARTNPYGVAPAVVSPQDSALPTRLDENLIELRTKSALLLSLADEHLKKSEQANSLNQPEKARWEQELATDLQHKNSLVSNELSGLVLDHTKSDEAHGLAASAKSRGLDSDELAYLAKLTEVLATTEHEIAAVTDEAQYYVAQLQTNKAPDQIQNLYLSLDYNKNALKELRKQQSDLELKKLEFWAYRRRK